MRPHEQLDVWKKSVDFTVEVYKVTESFPKDERFGLISQIRRAAVSIAANIAEGAGRRSDKEFLNFLSMSQGSASEVETELLIAFRLGYISEEIFQALIQKTDEIGRMISGLCSHIKTRLQP
jgi:four helix bundle protein